MATTKKKVTAKKLPASDEFIIVNDCYDHVVEGAMVEEATDALVTLVQDDDGGDTFYEGREYSIYKLVKRVRVNIEHPLPVVKLISVKD